jgi:hypothetical protein
MATVGKQDTPKKDEKPTEVEVDYMRDAPPERPYADAVTEEHRAFLFGRGVVLPAPSEPKAEPAGS